MKILDSIWFCAGHGNVGIVKCFDDYEGICFYIGQCRGEQKDSDEQWIADFGSRFPYVAGIALFGESP